MSEKIKLLAICGSLDADSKTMKALKVSIDAATSAGAEVELVDLREYRLPILNAPDATSESQAEVERLKAAFRGAHALLVASPEYHGSFSGSLKNAFDLMGFEEFEGKMVALIGVAGGALGATNALNHMRVVCRQLHAWVVPDQVSVAKSYEAFDENGQPRDEGLTKRLSALGTQLVKFATLHTEASTNPFVKLWEQCVANPGGQEH